MANAGHAGATHNAGFDSLSLQFERLGHAISWLDSHRCQRCLNRSASTSLAERLACDTRRNSKTASHEIIPMREELPSQCLRTTNHFQARLDRVLALFRYPMGIGRTDVFRRLVGVSCPTGSGLEYAEGAPDASAGDIGTWCAGHLRQGWNHWVEAVADMPPQSGLEWRRSWRPCCWLGGHARRMSRSGAPVPEPRRHVRGDDRHRRSGAG
jgi:hypothetical protein